VTPAAIAADVAVSYAVTTALAWPLALDTEARIHKISRSLSNAPRMRAPENAHD
jgi:hypothetical protein